MRAEFHACPNQASLRDKKPTQFLRASAKLALMGFSPGSGVTKRCPESGTRCWAWYWNNTGTAQPRPSAATREAHRSRPRRRPRPRESLFVANWVGIGSMCPVRIAPALRVEDAFRAVSLCDSPRAKDAQGYSLKPLRGIRFGARRFMFCFGDYPTTGASHVHTPTRRYAQTP